MIELELDNNYFLSCCAYSDQFVMATGFCWLESITETYLLPLHQ